MPPPTSQQKPILKPEQKLIQKPELPRQQERRRQLRALLLLAAAVLAFSLLRAHHVFTPGWWRLW